MVPNRVKEYVVLNEADQKRIAACLEGNANVSVIDIEGAAGLGKTANLATIYHDVKNRPSFFPVYVLISESELMTFPETDQNAVDSKAYPLHNIAEYLTLLKDLAEDLPEENFKYFSTLADRLTRDIRNPKLRVEMEGNGKGGNVKFGAFAKVENTVIDASFRVVLPEKVEPTEAEIAKTKDDITRSFAHCVKVASRKYRLVLLIDDFQILINHQVGRWLMQDLVPKLNNSVVIVARSKSQDKLPVHPDFKTRIRLGYFQSDQVTKYLKSQFNGSKLPKGLSSQVFKFSKGHPQALRMAVDIIHCYGLDQPGLLDIFESMPQAISEQLLEGTNLIIEKIGDEDFEKAVKAAAIVRNFEEDGKLLSYMLAEGDMEDEADEKELAIEFAQIITRIKKFFATDKIEDPKKGISYYKFRDSVRRVFADDLQQREPDLYNEYQMLAADFYGEWLIDHEDELKDSNPYARWLRYDNPEWQNASRQWLYHLERTSDRNMAGRHFAKIYFEAFWWWGWYTKFPLCEQLLKDWERTQTSPADRKWLKLIRLFHYSYPTGYDKHGKGDWLAVRKALKSIRQLGGFGRKISDEEDYELCELRAITDDFLGESYRYLDLDNKNADFYFQDAYKYFEKIDDTWNMTWALFDLGDTCLERGLVDKAMDYCHKSLALAKENEAEEPDEPPDYEIVANNYRLLGDLSWKSGDIDGAFENYAKAEFYAYAFHGYPPPPDFYSLFFYREMKERIQMRLWELYEGNQAELAIKMARFLHDFWTTYWETADQPSAKVSVKQLLSKDREAELETYLFPPEPKDDDIDDESSMYLIDVQYVVEEMKEQIEKQT